MVEVVGSPRVNTSEFGSYLIAKPLSTISPTDITFELASSLIATSPNGPKDPAVIATIPFPFLSMPFTVKGVLSFLMSFRTSVFLNKLIPAWLSNKVSKLRFSVGEEVLNK